MVIKINGTEYDPSEMTFGIQDVSAPDSGRDLSGYMWKLRVCAKRTIQLAWWQPSPALVSQVLTSVSPEYFSVQYTDPETNTLTTKTFYVGDRTIPTQVWGSNVKRYQKLSFKLIER